MSRVAAYHTRMQNRSQGSCFEVLRFGSLVAIVFGIELGLQDVYSFFERVNGQVVALGWLP
jgi:hypothetical protein